MKAKVYKSGDYIQSEPKNLPDDARKVLIVINDKRFTITVNSQDELVINKSYEGLEPDQGAIRIRPSVSNEIRISI